MMDLLLQPMVEVLEGIQAAGGGGGGAGGGAGGGGAGKANS